MKPLAIDAGFDFYFDFMALAEALLSFSVHIPMGQKVLKIKSANRLRDCERGGQARVLRLGDMVLVLASKRKSGRLYFGGALKPARE